MNCTRLGAIVDEANDALSAFLHPKSWTGRDAIVTNKLSGLLARVDLLRKGQDVDLVVVNRLLGDGVCDCPAALFSNE